MKKNNTIQYNTAEIGKEWEKIATTAPTIQDAKNKVLNKRLVNLLEKYKKSGKDVFDYGCGWGEWADLLSKKKYNVTAYDENDGMVLEARKKFAKPAFLTKNELHKKLLKLKGTFDIVTSNLVLCILKRKLQDVMLENMKTLAKKDGLILMSFCHPCFDYDTEGIVTIRTAPKKANYEESFTYNKTIKENSIHFHDLHRPLAYFSRLFNDHGLEILEINESDTLKTNFKPDFIMFALRKK